MFSKINIANIVADHIRTFKLYRPDSPEKGNYNIFDFILFLGLPAAVAVAMVAWYGLIQDKLVTLLATFLAIFAALLFNLLLLIYDIIRRSVSISSATTMMRTRLLREIVSNISFAILTAMLSIILLVVNLLIANCKLAEYVIDGAVYYFVSVFFLTILMLLKRIYVILNREIGTGNVENQDG